MNRLVAPILQVTLALAVSLGCYLVSARVGAERASVARLRAQIARDTAGLATMDAELARRAGLGRLEAWNASSLAMAAPDARRVLAGPQALVAMFDVTPVSGVVRVAVPAAAAVTPDGATARTAVRAPDAGRAGAVRERPRLIAASLSDAGTRAGELGAVEGAVPAPRATSEPRVARVVAVAASARTDAGARAALAPVRVRDEAAALTRALDRDLGAAR